MSNTRRDIAARLAEVQGQIAQGTVQTLLEANRTLRDAQEHSQVSVTYKSLDPKLITFVSFGDAAFASKRDPRSQQGTVIAATTTDLSNNVQAPLSPLVWTCKKISRVFRSTISAEAYAMSKSVDTLGWIRALWGCIHVTNFRWDDPQQGFQSLNNALIITDCKALYL